MTGTAPPLPDLPPHCLAWFEYLASQKRLAPTTLDSYRIDMQRLLAHTHELELTALTRHDIRRCAARLHAHGLGGRTIGRTLSAWRGFYAWLLREGHVDINPVLGVRAPRSIKRLPRTLSPDQANAMLDAEPDGLLELRDRAMFELLYASGLRVSELASLNTVGSLDFADQTLTVAGKRSKTRSVPVGSAALAAVSAWLDVRAHLAAADEPALFVTRSGTRMSTSAIAGRLQRWALAQGVGQPVHPHMLRHSFASHLLQSSGDLRAVQELLGHASIRSTQVYTHLDFQHLASVYDAAHPRARKR